MNLSKIGIVKKENINKEKNEEIQNKKARTILKLNSIEVFKAVDFLVDYKLENEDLIHRHMYILDVGTRIGSAIKRFNQRGFKRTRGIDISPGAIKNALKYDFNVRIENIEENSDFEKDYFDVLFSRHMLEHCIDLNKAVNGMLNKLKKDGILFLIVPINLKHEEFIPTHNYNFFKYDSLLKLILNIRPTMEILYYNVKMGSELEMWLVGRKC